MVLEPRDSCKSDVTAEDQTKFTQKCQFTDKCPTFVQFEKFSVITLTTDPDSLSKSAYRLAGMLASTESTNKHIGDDQRCMRHPR